MSLDIYIDGASKGNPGPSGIGIVLCRGDEVVKNISLYIGEYTNNVAEYIALIHGLQEALLLKEQQVNIFTDSELLFRQLKGIYKIKHPNLQGLYQQAKTLWQAFKHINIQHIPREQNRGADKLANLAVKKRKAGVVI